MNYEQELAKTLNELKRVTGLDFSIRIEDKDQMPEVIRQIRGLSSAYKEKNNKNLVMKKWLTGSIAEDEFFDLAKKLHIPIEENRILYLITMDGADNSEIITVLKNMFPNNSNIWLIPINATQLVLLYSFYRIEPNLKEIAYAILDTLNTEALAQVKIAYSEVNTHLLKLPSAYRQACFAMEVGETFYCNQSIYGHDNLGLGRLLHNIPDTLCRDYIKEKLNRPLTSYQSTAFNADILHTVNSFLDNNLNIAETARQLHIHRNTLLYRLEQIEKETGLDIRQFHQAMTYKIASLILLKLSESDSDTNRD